MGGGARASVGPGVTAIVRTALPTDLEAIDVIERASFGDPWSLRSFSDSMTHSFVRINVVEVAGGVVGYSVVWLAGEESELANLAIEPGRRGAGLGALLLDAVLQEAHEEGALVIFLEVRESNAAARSLYARRGFHEVGRRTGYYRNPSEDALVLRRDLG